MAKVIEDAKTLSKINENVVVVESRFADEKRLAQDFAIDRHIRWASYFDEI